MKFTIAAVIAGSFAALASTSALADTCAAQATAKKLHGAAETSFVKKCTSDAQAKCDADAKEKKLSGAAKKSFTTKCVKDATGA
ncbi:MAG: PsiF family protein [Hyphomicrobium sp.]